MGKNEVQSADRRNAHARQPTQTCPPGRKHQFTKKAESHKMIALNIGNMPDQLATSTNITSSEVDNSAIGVVKSQYTVSWAARVFQGFVGWHAFF